MLRQGLAARAVAACALLLLAVGPGAVAQDQATDPKHANWTRPFEPFHLFANIYWVGSYDLSTYLLTTPEGNILINTGVGDSPRQIAANIAKLGFKVTDTKILTATHGHHDHVSGMAELKRMTGAKLVISENDRELLETGGKADFFFGTKPEANFEPVKVDRTFKDGETIALGGTVLTAHLHPGHTKGATSFTLDVKENGKDYRVLIANMPTVNTGAKLTGMPGYPTIAQDYVKTFAALKAMKTDVWLASHASQFHLHEKYKPGDAYNPDRFVDPKGFHAALTRLEKSYLVQLEEDRAAK